MFQLQVTIITIQYMDMTYIGYDMIYIR